MFRAPTIGKAPKQPGLQIQITCLPSGRAANLVHNNNTLPPGPAKSGLSPLCYIHQSKHDRGVSMDVISLSIRLFGGEGGGGGEGEERKGKREEKPDTKALS